MIAVLPIAGPWCHSAALWGYPIRCPRPPDRGTSKRPSVPFLHLREFPSASGIGERKDCFVPLSGDELHLFAQ